MSDLYVNACGHDACATPQHKANINQIVAALRSGESFYIDLGSLNDNFANILGLLARIQDAVDDLIHVIPTANPSRAIVITNKTLREEIVNVLTDH